MPPDVDEAWKWYCALMDACGAYRARTFEQLPHAQQMRLRIAAELVAGERNRSPVPRRGRSVVSLRERLAERRAG